MKKEKSRGQEWTFFCAKSRYLKNLGRK
jgi:hypothetical protein